MSTNYYVRPRPHGVRAALARLIAGREWPSGGEGIEIHLGKSAIGWAFMFRAYPAAQPPVTDYASWLRLLDLGDIYDEYDRQVKRSDLLSLISSKREGRKELGGHGYLDPSGNRFIPEWFS